jgi:hypothetical protein
MNEALSGTYFCASCGAENEILVDPSAGPHQSYVEDCSVCCRPQVLTVVVDESKGTVEVHAEFEG